MHKAARLLRGGRRERVRERGREALRARLVKVWLDGALVDGEASACIAPSDHGFLRRGRRVRDAALVRRAGRSRSPSTCARLRGGRRSDCGIAMPRATTSSAAAHAVLEANGLADARMRITVTSGPGPPGLAARRRAADRAGRRAAADAVAADRDRDRRRALRRDERSPLAGVKTMSLAESVIALAEARAAGADEALLLNTRGELCEATTANVFLVHDGIAATPPLDAGLPGRHHARARAGARARSSARCRRADAARAPRRRSSPRRPVRCSRWSTSTAARSATASRAR